MDPEAFNMIPVLIFGVVEVVLGVLVIAFLLAVAARFMPR